MKKIMFNDQYGQTDAVLRGKKTQKRCVIKLGLEDIEEVYSSTETVEAMKEKLAAKYARYKVGEVVAVAQSYKDAGLPDARVSKMFVHAESMPHRIRITDVHVERLQDISDEDCIKEGLEWDAEGEWFYTKYRQQTPAHRVFGRDPRKAYAGLADKILGKGTWERNPLVFVYDFELVESK